MPDDLKDSILSIFEASLEAQIRAVKHLRRGGVAAPAPRREKRMSQVDMAYDILRKARFLEVCQRLSIPIFVYFDGDHLPACFTERPGNKNRGVAR